MDYDELERKYGQRYCFAPYQADLYYEGEIRMHLLNLQEQCKMCHTCNIKENSAYRQTIGFFERLPAMEHRLLARLDRALHIPYQEERYVEVRVVVWAFFKKFRESQYFDWP